MEEDRYLIDINDFYNTWDNEVIWAVKKYKTKHNKVFNEELLMIIEVIMLLVWYGINMDKILEIKLEDVSYNGIKGYDIKFDDRTLDLFMRYKEMDGLKIEHGVNGTLITKKFKQDTFYRTVTDKKVDDGTDTRTIKNNVSKELLMGAEDDIIHKLFTPANLYYNGSFCFVYDKLIESGKKFNKANVEEYLVQFGYNMSAPSAIKFYYTKFNKYVKYRQKWEQEHPVQEKTDNTEVATETTRVSAEEVKELVENIANNPISVEQVDIPKMEQDNAVDTCLNILNGLRTTMELVSNQIDTIESVLKTLKQ